MAKIVHVISGLGVGGAERALHTLLTSGLQDEYDNHVVSLTDSGHYGRILDDGGIPVTSLNIKANFVPISSYKQVKMIFSGDVPIVLQGWMSHGNIAASFFRRWFCEKAALCWNVRSSLEGLSHAKRSLRVLSRLGVKMSSGPDCIFFNSVRSLEQHLACGYPQKNSFFIPNGFDTSFWRPGARVRSEVRAEFGLTEAQCVVGFVGRGHEEKDPENFSRAIKILQRRYPNVIVVVVGRGLEQIGAGRSGVIVVGERVDIDRLMRSFDFLCLSSREEGFPNVLGEAMASGIPCVSTNVGDAAEIVGSTGWIVPANDSQALGCALVSAVETPQEELLARGLAARKRIQERFSIDAMLEQYISHYNRILKGRFECVG